MYLALIKPFLKKQRQKRGIKNWFEGMARNIDGSNLHAASGWGYLTSKQYEELILDGIAKMSPPILDGEKVFEFGCGVGAALNIIANHKKNLILGGLDISENAIEQIKKIFPQYKDNFFTADMAGFYKQIPDNYYDHCISFGALAMYLREDEMLKAIKQAVRITKPGGSLLFTQFIDPNGKRVGSIITRIDKNFFHQHADELGIESIKIYDMLHQDDRYQVAFTKKQIALGK